MRRLTRNMIQCKYCGDVIESTYTHDFKWCSCKSVYIDGGLEYARRGFVNSADDYTELSVWSEDGEERD